MALSIFILSPCPIMNIIIDIHIRYLNIMIWNSIINMTICSMMYVNNNVKIHQKLIQKYTT